MSFAEASSGIHANRRKRAADAAKAPYSAVKILLLPPNLITHLRVLLLATSVALGLTGAHLLSIEIFVLGFALDAVDGWAARKFNAATSFGAFYDVAVDIASRGILWTWRSNSPFAVLPVLLECFTLVCTHQAILAGQKWKATLGGNNDRRPPWFVSKVMAGGSFRSTLGVIAVFGLFGCPLWVHMSNVGLVSAKWGLLAVLPARLVAASVEVWVIWNHLIRLLEVDVASRAEKTL